MKKMIFPSLVMAAACLGHWSFTDACSFEAWQGAWQSSIAGDAGNATITKTHFSFMGMKYQCERQLEDKLIIKTETLTLTMQYTCLNLTFVTPDIMVGRIHTNGLLVTAPATKILTKEQICNAHHVDPWDFVVFVRIGRKPSLACPMELQGRWKLDFVQPHNACSNNVTMDTCSTERRLPLKPGNCMSQLDLPGKGTFDCIYSTASPDIHYTVIATGMPNPDHFLCMGWRQADNGSVEASFARMPRDDGVTCSRLKIPAEFKTKGVPVTLNHVDECGAPKPEVSRAVTSGGLQAWLLLLVLGVTSLLLTN